MIVLVVDNVSPTISFPICKTSEANRKEFFYSASQKKLCHDDTVTTDKWSDLSLCPNI